MKERLRKLLSMYAVLLLIGIFPVYGQPSPERMLEEVRTAYQQFDYAEAEVRALRALEAFTRFSPVQLVELNTLLARVKYAQNEPAEARRYFIAALSLDPDLVLDPVLVSPKILTFFEALKAERGRVKPSSQPEEALVRYVVVNDPRPAAALRSMLVPGWGQLYLGQSTRGRVLIGLWGLAVTGSVVAHVQQRHAREAYLNETLPTDTSDPYQSYNAWYKARNNLALGAAIVWLYSFVDTLSARYASARQPRAFTAVPGLVSGEVNVTLRFKF